MVGRGNEPAEAAEAEPGPSAAGASRRGEAGPSSGGEAAGGEEGGQGTPGPAPVEDEEPAAVAGRCLTVLVRIGAKYMHDVAHEVDEDKARAARKRGGAGRNENEGGLILLLPSFCEMARSSSLGG